VPFSRHRRSDALTPLADVAKAGGLTLTTRVWLERTVADVAFDSFAFGHDVLCAAPVDGFHPALERGRRADGVTLAVASLAWPSLPPVWIAAQSKRSDNHLDLDLGVADAEIGDSEFDSAFCLDVDDDALDVVKSILTADLCKEAMRFEQDHGPLIVVFDGAEAETHDDAAHRSAVFLAREVSNDEEFVETLAITIELVSRFRSTAPG